MTPAQKDQSIVFHNKCKILLISTCPSDDRIWMSLEHQQEVHIRAAVFPWNMEIVRLLDMIFFSQRCYNGTYFLIQRGHLFLHNTFALLRILLDVQQNNNKAMSS
jgi:hypothetical protein